MLAEPTAPDPDVRDSGGTLDSVFAVRTAYNGTLHLDDAGRPAYENIGFALDCTCPEAGQRPSCVEPPWALGNLHDGPGGIDNALERASAMLAPPVTDLVVTSSESVPAVLRIRSYSGEADDDQVEVSVYLAYGLTPRDDGSVGPFWDGKDRWNILQDTLLPLGDAAAPTFSVDQPLFTDKAAYVSNWTFVAHFPEALDPSGLISAPAVLHRVVGVVIAGQLAREGDAGEAWTLRNTVTGLRLPVAELLPLLAMAPLPGDAGPVCSSAASYDVLKGGFCAYVDMAAQLDASPNSPCDAISQGVLTQLEQVELGQIVQSSPAPPLQCAAGVHPETDTCGPKVDP